MYKPTTESHRVFFGIFSLSDEHYLYGNQAYGVPHYKDQTLPIIESKKCFFILEVYKKKYFENQYTIESRNVNYI